jgi:hypothetical protein
MPGEKLHVATARGGEALDGIFHQIAIAVL